MRCLTSQIIQTSSKYLFLGCTWPFWSSRKNTVCPHFTRLCRRTGNLTSHPSPSLSCTLCQWAVKKVVSKSSRLKNWPGPCEQLLPLFLKRNWKTSVRKLTFMWHPLFTPIFKLLLMAAVKADVLSRMSRTEGCGFSNTCTNSILGFSILS